MEDVFGHALATRAGQGGGARRGDLSGNVSRPTATGRIRIGPANAAAAATVGHRILLFSFSSDSSPFERYDENKFGRRLDRVFWPPQQPLDQGKGTVVFLVSWDFR